jgi:hypothetical protein
MKRTSNGLHETSSTTSLCYVGHNMKSHKFITTNYIVNQAYEFSAKTSTLTTSVSYLNLGGQWTLPKMKRGAFWPMPLDWTCLVGGMSIKIKIKIEMTPVIPIMVITDERKGTSRPSFPMMSMDEPAMPRVTNARNNMDDEKKAWFGITPTMEFIEILPGHDVHQVYGCRWETMLSNSIRGNFCLPHSCRACIVDVARSEGWLFASSLAKRSRRLA